MIVLIKVNRPRPADWLIIALWVLLLADLALSLTLGPPPIPPEIPWPHL